MGAFLSDEPGHDSRPAGPPGPRWRLRLRSLRSAETDRRRRQARLEAILGAIPDVVVEYDAQGRVVWANRAAQDVAGFPQMNFTFEQAIRTLRFRSLEGVPMDPERAPTRRALAGEHVRGETYAITTADGRDRVVSAYAEPLVQDGAVAGVVALWHDISDLHAAEATLREVSQRLTYHVDNSPLAVIEWGADMRLTRWSREAERIFGWTAAEVLGKRMEDFRWVYQEDEEQVGEVSRDLRRGVSPSFSLNRNYRKDGSVIHCEWYNSSLVDPDGSLRSILSLVLDVTERVRLEAALKAEAARKDEFLALLGHELRNPLAPICNAVYLIRRAGGDRALVEQACAIAEHQVHHITRLVDDLLDVSRIARGKIQLKLEQLDLVSVVQGVLEDYRPVFAERRLFLEGGLPGAPITIHADRARIVQAVSNLLHNAMKFSDPGGRVQTVVAREDAGWCRVTVADQGLGIPPGSLESIFEPFTQRQETLARAQGGLGLGLALVKGLVERHGGTVTASSDGPGLGSIFTVRLPVAPGAMPQPGVAGSGQEAGRGRRILVVEDHPDVALTLRLVLERAGHTVALAGDGRAALAQAAGFRPDLVLCDLGLPGGMDGYGVARTLAADPGSGRVPLVAVSGFGSAEDKARALAAGFRAHLTKPVDPDLLVRMVAELA